MTSTKSWVVKLLSWYQANKRDLPWRKTKDPYAIWVSEIMLQQTQVETVTDYYQRFMERFPTIDDLARSDMDDVLKMWEGLGYYSRAKNLHRAAKQIAESGKGFPKTYSEVLALPGVGRYTAGAIMSIAFQQPYPAVDGNVMRVMARLLLLEQEVSSQRVKNQVEAQLQEVFPLEASDFSQGLMELGALICLPVNPHCEECPIDRECKARREKKQHQLPVKKVKAVPQKVKRYLALIVQDHSVLMNKRPIEGLLGGLWEFPGVEATTKRDFPEAFQREFGITITPQEKFMDTRHVFSHRVWEMKVHCCGYILDQGFQNTKMQWIPIKDLDQIAIPGAFQSIKEKLQRETKAGAP